MRFLFALLLLGFMACGPSRYQVQPAVGTTAYLHPKEEAADSQIQRLIQPYKQQLSAEMNRVVGTTARSLPKGQPESLLGNWAADLVLHYCQQKTEGLIDFAVLNLGGLRIPSLPKGDITKGKLFELMPFDNSLVILEVSGTVVQQLFEHIAQKGGWPVSTGVKMKIDQGQAQEVRLKGRPIEAQHIYRIATNSYIANGGDDCAFFVGQAREELGILFRDALIEYSLQCTEKGQILDAQLERRIELKE